MLTAAFAGWMKAKYMCQVERLYWDFAERFGHVSRLYGINCSGQFGVGYRRCGCRPCGSGETRDVLCYLGASLSLCCGVWPMCQTFVSVTVSHIRTGPLWNKTQRHSLCPSVGRLSDSVCLSHTGRWVLDSLGEAAAEARRPWAKAAKLGAVSRGLVAFQPSVQGVLGRSSARSAAARFSRER